MMIHQTNNHNRKTPKSFPWPKEHGAWALLLVPYWTGVAAGGDFSAPVMEAFIALVLLLFAKRPLFAGFRRTGSWLNRVRGLALMAVVSALLAASVRSLDIRSVLWWLVLGVIAAAILVLLELGRGRRDIIREIVAVPLLVLSAPFGFQLAGGADTRFATLLWFFMSLALSGLVLYARTMITIGGADTRFRKRRDVRSIVSACRVYHVALAPIVLIPGFAGLWSPQTALAFIPVALQGIIIRIPGHNGIRTSILGIGQTIQAVLFAILLFIII